MDAELDRLSAEHRAKLPASFDSTAIRRAMFEEYTSRDQDLITDATAIAAALSATVLSRTFSVEDLSLEAREAFTLAFPHLDVSALTGATQEQLERWIGPWKERLFDVLVRDALNAGRWIGDLFLEPWQVASINPASIDPDHALSILDASGHLDHAVSAGLTAIRAARAALEHVDLHVLTGAEAVQHGQHVLATVADSVSAAGVNDHSHDLIATAIDGQANLATELLELLPFVVILGTEGRAYMMERKTFEEAAASVAQRGVAATSSLVVWHGFAAVGAGAIGVPFAVVARCACMRYFRFKDFERSWIRQLLVLRRLLPRSEAA